MASSRSVTNGVASYCTSTSRAASSAISWETAATAAISCPAKRTHSASAVQTAFTPGSRSALAVSIRTILPAGIGARTILAQSIPGSCTS